MQTGNWPGKTAVVRLTSSGEVLFEHAEKLFGEYSNTLKDPYVEHTFSSAEDNRRVIHMKLSVRHDGGCGLRRHESDQRGHQLCRLPIWTVYGKGEPGVLA